jgi:hypothetical protein
VGLARGTLSCTGCHGQTAVDTTNPNEVKRLIQFLRLVFGAAGLDWRQDVEEDRSLLGRRTGRLAGNSVKLRSAAGWVAQVGLDEIARRLLAPATHEAG